MVPIQVRVVLGICIILDYLSFAQLQYHIHTDINKDITILAVSEQIRLSKWKYFEADEHIFDELIIRNQQNNYNPVINPILLGKFQYPRNCEPDFGLYSNYTEVIAQNNWIILDQYYDKKCYQVCQSIEIKLENAELTASFPIKEPCSSKLKMVSVRNNKLMKLPCPDKYFATNNYELRRKCFTIKRVEPNESDQLVSFETINDDKRTLLKAIASELAINSTVTVRDNNSNKYFTYRNDYEQTISEKDVPTNGYMFLEKAMKITDEPKIKIEYDKINDQIKVNIKNDQFLVRSAMDNIPFVLQTNGRFFPDEVPMFYRVFLNHADEWHQYVVGFDEKQPGIFTYSCSAIQFSNLILESNTITVRRNTDNLQIFIGTMVIPNTMVNNSTNIKMLLKKQFHTHAYNLEEFQVKKVLSINTKSTTVVVHFIYENENSMPEKFHQLKNNFEKICKSLVSSGITVTNIRNMDYCFSDDDTFPPAKFKAVSVYTRNLCLLKNGILPQKMCSNFDPVYGVSWDSNKTIVDFKCQKDIENNETKTLIRLVKLPETNAIALTEKAGNITDFLANKSISVTDVVVLSEYLKQEAETLTFDAKINLTDNLVAKLITSVTTIADSIMSVNESMLDVANKNNATPNALGSLETIFDLLTTSPNVKLDDHGVLIINQTKNFIFGSINPWIKNITGMAVFADGQQRNIKYLYANDNLKKYLTSNLIAAFQIPWDNLRRIKVSDDKDDCKPLERINFKLFLTDALHRNVEETHHLAVPRKIVSVTIPNYSKNELPFEYTIVLNKNNTSVNNRLACDTSEGISEYVLSESKWNKTVLEEMSDEESLYYTHKTKRLMNVGLLSVFGEYANKRYDNHAISKRIAELISIIGCSLSLVGVSVIILTYVMFDHFRKDSYAIHLFHTAIALFMHNFLFLSKQIFKLDIYACFISGRMLQYFTLVLFFLSLFCAYRDYNAFIVIQQKQFIGYLKWKIIGIGWIIPLTIVIISSSIECLWYLPFKSQCPKNSTAICYPHGIILNCAVLLPAFLVILTNSTLYIAIIFNVQLEKFRFKKQKFKKVSSCRHDLICELRMFSFCFVSLCLPWAFGLICQIPNIPIILYVISLHLFMILASCQGFIMFLIVVFQQSNMTRLWIRYIRQLRKSDF